MDSSSTEATDANNAVSDVLVALRETSNNCESLADGIRERLGDFQVANPLLDNCGTLNVKYSEIDSKRALAFGGLGSTNSKVEALNELTDQALAQADLADQALASLQDAQLVFDLIITDLLKYSIDFATAAESVANLNNRISGLPKTTQTMIKKNANYKKLSSVFPAEYDLEETISSSLPDLSSISTNLQLKNVQNLIAKARTSNGTVFNSGPLLKAIEKLIPKYVCIKGKTVSVTPATGKCASGSVKTSTS
jgi:hypothetical protein